VQLLLLHPEVAYRSCEDCQKYVYDHETGKREEYPPGSGNPVKRILGQLPPCSQGPTVCPKVSPDAGIELNEKNQECYRHYLECRTTGTFPDDPVVRENAAIIRSIEDAATKIESRETLISLSGMLGSRFNG